MIIFNPYKQFNAMAQFGWAKQVKWASTWEEVLAELSDRGEGTKAAVIVESMMAMFSDDFKKEYEPVNLNLEKQDLVVK